MNNLVLFQESNNTNKEKELMSSFEGLFHSYNIKKNEIIRISGLVEENEITQYFISGNGGGSYSSSFANSLFKREGAIKSLDSEYWSTIMNKSGVLEFMPAKMRTEWGELIRTNNTPSFDQITVLETLKEHMLKRGSYLAEKVDGIFQRLSRKHVTNSPFAFRERLIISNVHDDGNSNDDTGNYIDDLREVIAIVRNQDKPKNRYSNMIWDILRNKQFGEWIEFDGGAFKMKVFKVGTAHFEVHPDVATKLNQILAIKYPNQISCESNGVDSFNYKKPKVKPLQNKEICEDALFYLDRLKFDHINSSVFASGSSLTDSAFEDVKKVLTHLGGIERGPLFTFDYNPLSAINYVIRMGCLPDKKSYQFYPTKEELATDMAMFLSNKLNGYYRTRILEPSAGTGSLADAFVKYSSRFKKENFTCIELSPLNCEVLREKNYNVIEKDFLEYNDSKFEAILMNPPFNQGQAVAHVKHAYNLLEKGGTLVACIPSSFKGKEIIKGASHSYSVVYQDQFDETGVSVVILTICKK